MGSGDGGWQRFDRGTSRTSAHGQSCPRADEEGAQRRGRSGQYKSCTRSLPACGARPAPTPPGQFRHLRGPQILPAALPSRSRPARPARRSSPRSRVARATYLGMLTLRRQLYSLKLRDGVWLDQTSVPQRQQQPSGPRHRGPRRALSTSGGIRTWWAGEGLLLRDEEVVVSPPN